MIELDKTVRVSAAIIRQAERILVCQRCAGGPHGLKWEFPGGKIEGNETPEECLRRELREELGIAATVGALFTRIDHSYPDGPTVELWFFDIASYDGAIQNRIFADLRWVTPDELEGIDLLEADRPLIEMLREQQA